MIAFHTQQYAQLTFLLRPTEHRSLPTEHVSLPTEHSSLHVAASTFHSVREEINSDFSRIIQQNFQNIDIKIYTLAF